MLFIDLDIFLVYDGHSIATNLGRQLVYAYYYTVLVAPSPPSSKNWNYMMTAPPSGQKCHYFSPRSTASQFPPKCGHIRHWKPKCRGGAPPQRQSGKRQHPGKGKKKPQRKKGCTNFVDVNEYDSQYDEIDIHFINVKPDLNFTDDPDEIKVDDVAKPK